MVVLPLTTEMELPYEIFLGKQANALLYHTNSYRRLLKHLLAAEDRYLIAVDENEIIGVLPAFLVRNEKSGNVLNSLPFYGSHGSIVCRKDMPEHEREIKRTLLTAFMDYAHQQQCVSTTIIVSPFETDLAFYEENTSYTFRDTRIGQLTKLPADVGMAETAIMDMCHTKTRNMVRKAQKLGITCRQETSDDAWAFLVDTHRQNMAEIGGIPKPLRFFQEIPHCFHSGRDFSIYMAYLDDRPVAAMLLLYFNGIVEYFTPVVKAEFRSLQPLSMLIHQAMGEAVRAGYAWWNWGGTWLTQDGVYHFKKRWGTVDMPYYYYTKIMDDSILDCTRQELLTQYPFFYVAPFDKLRR